MTVREFENGYWYLDQLKNFAWRIGIPGAKKLRKDELEKATIAFLKTGHARLPTKRSLRKAGVKDVERGLNLKLRIEHYTSNRETKDFIIEQARQMGPPTRLPGPFSRSARRCSHPLRGGLKAPAGSA
jgi:SAP domain-containing protein